MLPAASCALLPGPFQPLMLDPHSPVIDFYPTEFEVRWYNMPAEFPGPTARYLMRVVAGYTHRKFRLVSKNVKTVGCMPACPP